MSYTVQIAALAAINGLLGVAAYLPLTSGTTVVCMGTAMAFGAAAAAAVVGNGGGPALIGASLLAAGLAGMVAMFVAGAMVRTLSGFMLAVATLAIAECFHGLAINQPVLGGALGSRIPLLSFSPTLVFTVCAALLIAALALDRTFLRRAMALVAHSPRLSASIGIRVESMRWASITMGGLAAGVAGGLYLLIVGIVDPSWYGFEGGVQILVFAVLGGTRTALGPFLAGAGLTVLMEVLRVSADQRMISYGILLSVLMLLRPDGLSGKRRGK